VTAQLPIVESGSGGAERETALSRLLTVYVATGLAFMLFPGTFFGVWNLVAIATHRAPGSVSAAWIQAHGHAQIFGWIGSFILGIGFYSIPKLRNVKWNAPVAAWATWALWTSGVLLRWIAGVYQWRRRATLPISAGFELIAFLIFFKSVSGHRPGESGKGRLDPWIFAVIAGCLGLFASLFLNLGVAVFLSFRGVGPELPPLFDQRLLVLQTWGFLVPFVWGFSARWLPVFLGLRPTRTRLLLPAVALNTAAVIAALAGAAMPAALLLLGGLAVAICALRIAEPAERPAKTRGVHSSFPVFVRIAYLQAAIAAVLGIWAALATDSTGIAGASRHALTVGFLATMVFAIGQRVLPAFSGMRVLFSPRLMFIGLLLLTIGCLIRVSSEILAYQHVLVSAWRWLPASAFIEMTAVTVFAVNLLATFARPRQSEPTRKGISI